MREKQIEKVSQGLFIVTSVLAVSLLLLSAVFYPDLPAHVPIHVNFGARVIRLAQDLVYLCGRRSCLA